MAVGEGSASLVCFDVTDNGSGGGSGAYNKRAKEFVITEDCSVEIELYTGNAGRVFNMYNNSSTVVASKTLDSKNTKYVFNYDFTGATALAPKTYSFSGSGSKVYIAKITFTSSSSGSTDPVSSVTVSGATTGYATIPVALTATPDETATAYKWFVDGVEQDGQTSATFNFTTSTLGTYSIVAKARNDNNTSGEYIASSAHTVTISKLCGELIKIVQNGQSDGNVSGILTGTKDVKLSSGTSEYDAKTGRKIGSDNYWLGITGLNSTLSEGDEAVVFVTTESANLILYSDKGTTKIGEKIGGVTQGENRIALNSAATGKTAIYLYRVPTSTDANGGGNMNPFVHSLAVERSCTASNDCSIKSLTINGETITPAGKVYSYEVAAGAALTEVAVAYTTHFKATGTPVSGFNVTVPAAGDPANTQTITVTAEDGTTSDTYTVSVTKASAASDVVTLNDLGVTGYTLDPTFDAGTLAYTITKAYGAEDPGTDKVTYTKSEVAQTVEVTYDGTNHKFVVTVTAEDNTTTQDYEITINEAEAPKNLSRVLFSNGFDAFIDNTNHTVKAYYLAGQSAPTATTITAGAGTAGEYAAGKITVTGADASTVDYIVTLEAVTPNTTTVAAEAAAGEFAGDEAWVKNGLLIYGTAAGFNNDGKYYVNRRLLKSGDAADDQRVIAGWVRSYFFVGNAYKFIMTVGSNKALKYAIDGGTPVDANTETLEITLTAGNHMIEIVSNQSSGDCRLSAPKLVEMPTLYEVTYNAGEGSVKGGEVIPTQAATMEGGKFNLASGDALEKSGYDFTGWLCSVDAATYNAGDEYTMTAEATTFTAQWTLHVDPVDPTLTYNDGAYVVGLAALDLSTLINEKESTGAITYSVKTDGGTNAAIDGNNFTATAAGTTVITASQVAAAAYNAISVDFNVVVTVPAEVDGIKLVEAGALTGNFVSARTLSNGDNTVEGIAYTKYLTMSSTMTSFGNEVAPSATKGIYYYPSHKNIRFYFYVYNNQSSAKKIYIYTVDEDAEGTSDATSANVSVDAGRHMVYADVEITKHAAVVFGVENTGTQICQIVAVESGDALLQGGAAGYSIDYNKCYISPKANTAAVYDGIEYYLYADAKLVSATNVQLNTLGTHYIKFHLDAQTQVNVYADNHKYYVGSECSTGDDAKLYEATGNGEFTLAAGDWYINGSGAQVKINKLAFSAPKCEAPVFGTMNDIELCAGEPIPAIDGTATVSDGGDVTYKWYEETDPTAVLATTATYTPAADGSYYVIATNHLSGFADNAKQSATVTVTHFASAAITTAPVDVLKHVGLDATLSVTAEGKNLTYEWFTCDDELGTNPVAIVPAETGATLDLTAIEAGIKYYMVVVTDECSTSASAVAKVEGFNDLTLVDVTGDMEWDFSKANDGSAATSSMCTDAILANVAGINNNSDFESDNIMATANKFSSNKLQASMIKFHTTVDGVIKVVFSNTGSKSSERYLVVNGVKTDSGSKNTTAVTYYGFVPAGDVVLTVVEGDGNMLNFTSVKFIAKSAADLARDAAHGDDWMKAGELGTVCVPNGAVVVGGDIYTLEGKNSANKIVFATVPNNHVAPGVPYLFQSNGDAMYFYFTDEDAASEPNNGGAMKGTFTGVTLTDLTNVYYFAGHALWDCSDLTSLTVAANRAYVKMNEVTEIGSASPAPGRRYITMDVHGNNAPTGMDELNAAEAPVKMIIDGKLYILRGEKLYNANGQLVK